MAVDYKYKPDKHKFRVNVKTIDEMHKEHIDEFKKNRESIPIKKKKLTQLESELAELENSNGNKPINLDIEMLKKRNNLKRNIIKIKEEIRSIVNYSAEMNYYSRTGDVIYDYYNLTNGMLYGQNFEELVIKSNTNSNDNKHTDKNTSKIAISDELLAITNLNRKRKLKRPVRKRNKKIVATPNKSIMSYLVGSDDEKEKNDQDNTQCRASLQNEYLIMMDKEYACSKSKTSLIRKCKKCGIDKIIIYNESMLSCPKCGESDSIFIESDVPSHRETFNEKPKYPYKRKCHCIEKLNQFLCKGTANVPSDIFNILEEEVNKHGLEQSEITIQFLEKMLKKHRLSDYYEYIMFIYSKMTNTSPQTITREEYELVLKMFDEADEVYEKKFKPKSRNNFLKYTFALNKIFLTIGKKDIAKHFKLLKSPVKMKEQEKIWQLICNELGWKYHSS
jgi:hypothetical protein